MRSDISYFWRESRVLQQVLWSLKILLLQLSKYFSIILNTFSFKLLSEHIILNFKLVYNLIFKNMICIRIFYFKSKISLWLINHFRFILSNSFGKIFYNRVIVLVLLWDNKFISEGFIIFFILFYFLFKNNIFLFREFELLLFSLELKFEWGKFFIKCFGWLLGLGLFEPESGKEFFFFEYEWVLLI